MKPPRFLLASVPLAFPALLVALTFSDWQAANFTPTQLADTALSGATADPDGDGAANLHEYAFFGQPLAVDTNLAPTLELVSGTMALTYRQRHDTTDLSIRLQGSNTLTHWITYNTVIEADRESFTDYDEVTLLDPLAFTDTRRFLRLRVELLPLIELRPPTQLKLAVVTPNTWGLSWTDPNTSETGYAIERLLPTNAWERLATVGPDIGDWQHTSSDYQTSMIYRVVAIGTEAQEITSEPITPPDSDEDGIPDALELGEGYAGIPGTYATDPNASDTDGDGVSDNQEIRGGTNPTDYFNGQTPVITNVSGTDQSGPPGYFLLYPWVVKVTDAAGTPQVNAPVTFTASGATVGFATANDDSQPVEATLIVRTDSQGLARAFWKL